MNNLYRFLFVIAALGLSAMTSAQEQFNSLNELLKFTEGFSLDLKSDQVRLTQAKKAKLAAILGVIDPVASNNVSFIENTELPVSILPAEIFGGEPGTFREVQTGVPYNTTINQEVNIKLLNINGWKGLKLAKINVELSESNNLISRKNLHENIAGNYYNILSLQEQLKAARQNTQVADSLYIISKNRFDAGQVRVQDVNNTKANFLSAEENQRQISFLIKQYYLSLKILCDIPEQQQIQLTEDVSLNAVAITPEVKPNQAEVRNAMLNEDLALTTYKQLKSERYPTLSFVFSNTNQQFNQDFTVFGGDWVASNYIGLKATIKLPSATLISNRTKAKYDHELAHFNTQQAEIKSNLDAAQLANDYDKAVSQLETDTMLYRLNTDTYNKNKNLYQAGIISLDEVLNSFNAMVNANYQQIASKISTLLVSAKIDINNNMQ